MNLLLVYPDDFTTPDTIQVSDRRAQHIRKVLKAQPGDQIKAGMADGPMGQATLMSLSGNTVTLRVAWDRVAPTPLPVSLVLALPRPKVLRRVLQAVTSLGVKEVVLLHTYRVEKSYWQSPFLTPHTLQEQLALGLEQARDTMFPEIRMEKRFRPFVEDRLPRMLSGKTGYLAHPGEGKGFPLCPDLPSVLVVGPEGGLIPFEVEMLVKAGCVAHPIGERILKVETALPALLGRFISG